MVSPLFPGLLADLAEAELAALGREDDAGAGAGVAVLDPEADLLQHRDSAPLVGVGHGHEVLVSDAAGIQPIRRGAADRGGCLDDLLPLVVTAQSVEVGKVEPATGAGQTTYRKRTHDFSLRI